MSEQRCYHNKAYQNLIVEICHPKHINKLLVMMIGGRHESIITVSSASLSCLNYLHYFTPHRPLDYFYAILN